MLSLPNDGRYLPSNCSHSSADNAHWKHLLQQIEALAQQSPVLMIFEDVHWIDPTSLEALDEP